MKEFGIGSGVWSDGRGKEQEREEVDGLSTRAASWLEWTICALSMALTVLGLWLLVLGLSHPNVPVYSYWAEGTLLAVGYSTVGAVVASPRPGNPVGWALCSIGLSWGAYHFSSEYVTYALLAAPGSLPAAKAAVWIASWLWVPGLGLIVFLALSFPSGQLPSPRWRPFAWLSVLVVAVGTIVAAFLRVRGLALAYNLYRKLDAHTRTQAVARARELKLL